jgi:hypothetical protein
MQVEELYKALGIFVLEKRDQIDWTDIHRSGRFDDIKIYKLADVVIPVFAVRVYVRGL